MQVHIPRSGGTSIASWLRAAAVRGLTTGHAALYPRPAVVFRSEAELADAGFADPRVRTVASHDIRSYPGEICGRSVAYFTVLREPFARFGSLVRYTLLHRDEFRVPRSLRQPADVARWLIDARFGEVGSENEQTNHLALYPWCSKRADCEPSEYALWSGPQHHAYWNERLDIAKHVLRSFLCVAVMEQLVEGMAVLVERAATIGIPLLPVSELPFVNETAREHGDEDWMHGTDQLAEMIRDSMAADVQLYAFARELARQQYRETFASGRAALG